MDEIRKIINMVESHINEEGDLVSPSVFVASDPMKSIAGIISSINVLIGILDDNTIESTDRERIISELNNLQQNLAEVVQSVSPVLEDCDHTHGTSSMAPKIDRNGDRSYKDPSAPSYAARQGFTG